MAKPRKPRALRRTYIRAALGLIFLWLCARAIYLGSVELAQEWSDAALSAKQEELDRAKAQTDLLKEELKGLNFASPLWEAMPMDVDLMVRGNRISTEKGGYLRVNVPVGGRIELGFSKLCKNELGEWTTSVYVNASDERHNWIEGNLPKPLVVRRGEKYGPINIGMSELFVYVEDEKVGPDGIGEMHIAIYRRKHLGGQLNIGLSKLPPGRIKAPDRNTPRPALIRRTDELPALRAKP